eukprot:15482049-Alexandrium_andersonii.AAC.1
MSYPGYRREAAEEEAAEPLSPVAGSSFRALAARADYLGMLAWRDLTWCSRPRSVAGACRRRRARIGQLSLASPATSSDARGASTAS